MPTRGREYKGAFGARAVTRFARFRALGFRGVMVLARRKKSERLASLSYRWPG